MIFKILKNKINNGNYEKIEMLEKIDIFYAGGKLVKTQYDELLNLIGGDKIML